MSKGQFVTTLTLHAFSASLEPQMNDFLAGSGVGTSWMNQDLIAGHLTGEIRFKSTEDKATEIVSGIYALGPIHLELSQTQGKFGILMMAVPGLGIYRGEINEAGSIVVSEDRISQMLTDSAGNQREFLRLLRVSLGQSWDDILEPFRAARYSNNVVLLNKAG